MAWLLKFDGVNDYASFSPVSITGDFSISFTFRTPPTNATKIIVGQISSTDNYIARFSDTKIVIRIGAQSSNGITGTMSNTIYDATLTRVGSSVEFVIAGLGSESFTNSNTFNLDVFGRFSSGLYWDGAIQIFSIVDVDTPSNNVTWDATASNHGIGTPILVDTVGTNDATGVGFPTDGSAWEDLGGSGISVSATEVLKSFTENAIVNISYNVKINATESLSSFSDSAALSIENVPTTIVANETLQSFIEVATLSIDKNITIEATEVLNSFLDGANVTIAKDIVITATETLTSFNDNAFITLPANWVVKQSVSTSYTIKTQTSTNWIDKV